MLDKITPHMSLQRRKLILTTLPFLAILLVFVNIRSLGSPVIGFIALAVFMVANARTLGYVFFAEEKPFFRLLFGLFAFIVVLGLAGLVAVFVYPSSSWFLLGLILAASFCSVLSFLFAEHTSPKERTEKKTRITSFKGSYVLYGVYAAMLIWSFLILLGERSGWVRGPIWNIIPSSFVYVYFAATAVLVGIALLTREPLEALLLVVLHSIFSLSFIFIVSYPGIVFYDPWYDLGRARTILPVATLVKQLFPTNYVTPFWVPEGALTFIRLANMFLRGAEEHVLIATFAGALNIDMYWTYLLLLPAFWGLFVPTVSYRTAEIIGLNRKTALFAALLTIPNLYFLAWGKLTEATSFGVLLFFLLFYLLILYISSKIPRRIYFLAFLILIALLATHFVPALVSISFFVLAFAFKEYKKVERKSRRLGHLVLLLAFLVSLFIVPSLVIARGVLLPMIGTSSFSIDKLLGNSVWTVIFGMSEDMAVFRAMFYEVFPILGLIGVAYALRQRKELNRTLCLFFLLVLLASLVEHRILKYALEGGLFSPDRLRVFIDMVALPFAALAVSSAMFSLFGKATEKHVSFRWKDLLATVLICLSMSGWIVSSVYETYDYYTRGLQPTSLEVEAVKYIDEHTNSRYVVLAPHPITVISWGMIGIPNTDKWYFSIGRLGEPLAPSVGYMYDHMRMVGVDIGYFIASSFRGPNFDEIVAEAFNVFGFFKNFSDSNGNTVSIFNYRIPPLPDTPEVTAFYWDTPPAYYVQTDRMRIIINPESNTLDVVDFFGELYESVDFSRTLLDGNPIGSFGLIEYYDSVDEEWVEWRTETTISPSPRFEFRLQFDADTLIGVVTEGSSSVVLGWESGQTATWSLKTGDFTRLYIPGLVAGVDSYDVNSREYGFLYTRSLSDDVVLQPIFGSSIITESLTYDEIEGYGNFTRTQGHLSYDVYIQNTADSDQWAFIEMWLPDEIYTGSFPPLRHSMDDGSTWINTMYDVDIGGSQAITTSGGVDSNWIFTRPRTLSETPVEWWSFDEAEGGSPLLPDSFTDSGGAQNRIIFGFYLPASDKILVRLGAPIWYVSSLQISYVFTDSDDISYGIRNMNERTIRLYNTGISEYVGGLSASQMPTSLEVVEDEDGRIRALHLTLPPGTALTLVSQRDVDTTVDSDQNGIPDSIE